MTITQRKSTMEIRTGDVDALNQFLVQTLAACDQYATVLTHFSDHDTLRELTCSREEHQYWLRFLRAEVMALGGIPQRNQAKSINTLSNTMQMTSPQMLLTALRDAEESSYQKQQQTLSREDVSERCKRLIREQLLPHQRQQIARLNQLVDDYDD